MRKIFSKSFFKRRELGGVFLHWSMSSLLTNNKEAFLSPVIPINRGCSQRYQWLHLSSIGFDQRPAFVVCIFWLSSHGHGRKTKDGNNKNTYFFENAFIDSTLNIGAIENRYLLILNLHTQNYWNNKNKKEQKKIHYIQFPQV